MVVYAQRDIFYSGIFAVIGLECDTEVLSTILFEIRMSIWSPYFKKSGVSEIRNGFCGVFFKDKMLLL